MHKRTAKQNVFMKQSVYEKRKELTEQNESVKMKHVPVSDKVKKYMRIGRELIGSLLFPRRCPVCDEILSVEETAKGIHPACENKLFPVEGAVCMHCGRPLGQLYSPNRQKKNKIETENEKNNTGFDFKRSIPSYLTMESNYEYCQECRRKGYVPGFFSENNRKQYRQGTWNGYHDALNSASNIIQAKALYLYRGAVKTAMYRFKYANKREYAVFFARKAVERYAEWFGDTENRALLHTCKETIIRNEVPKDAPRFDIIIPVPMYRPKQKMRGYNQAEIFAEELSFLTGIPVDKNCIQRVKDTTPQKNLSGKERKINLENAFQITKSIVQYKHILLVDDIYTTGYTAETVAMELRKKGEGQIYLLSICIGGVN